MSVIFIRYVFAGDGIRIRSKTGLFKVMFRWAVKQTSPEKEEMPHWTGHLRTGYLSNQTIEV